MKRKLSKIIGFFYVLLVWITKSKKKITNGKSLIIITGNLGDALLSIEAVMALKNYYLNRQKSVAIVTSKTLWDFLLKIEDLNGIEYIDISFPYASNGTSFHKAREVVRQIKKYAFEEIVVTWANSPIAKYLVAAIPHNRSWGVFDDINRNSLLPKFFFERVFTNKILVPIDMQEMRRYRIMLEQIGVKDYKIRIHKIPEQICEMPSLPENRYITIALDSMTTERRWPTDNYKETINALLDKYDFDICCTGGAVAKPVYEECVQELSKEKRERDHSYVSKTSLQQWIELIRGAMFHIGVDSGSVHVAASVGTCAFCLVGVWDGQRVFPYDVDEKRTGTEIPIPVYRRDVNPFKLSCYGCLSIRGHRGLGNKECYRGCQAGEPALCLKMLLAKDVVNAIERYTK